MTGIALRCDGGAALGAGHVGRCVPIALALRAEGAEVAFVGAYDGVASWLLDTWNLPARPVSAGPCGLDAVGWDGAVVDLYGVGVTEICELAAALPIATPGEAARCPDRGVWIDYHVGAAEQHGPDRLGGPIFAPVDPRFAAARRARTDVRRVLVVAGGSRQFARTAGRLADAAAAAFPAAEIVAPAAVAASATVVVTALPDPVDLAGLAPSIDLAVTAAGMTTYELAAAGIPLVAVALVENQRVVADGCAATGVALPVYGIDEDPLPASIAALQRLRDPVVRADVSSAAVRAIDGHGAERIAKALLSAWTRPGASGPGR